MALLRVQKEIHKLALSQHPDLFEIAKREVVMKIISELSIDKIEKMFNIETFDPNSRRPSDDFERGLLERLRNSNRVLITAEFNDGE